jgi:hypothetical protein
MDWASVRHVEEPGALLVRERTTEVNVAFDAIEFSIFGFAIGAIGGMVLGVTKVDGHFFERPGFAACVHAHSHRSARAQGSQQKIVRGRSRVRAACASRLIDNEAVPPGLNFLRESTGAAEDDHIFALIIVFHCIGRIASPRNANLLIGVGTNRQSGDWRSQGRQF